MTEEETLDEVPQPTVIISAKMQEDKDENCGQSYSDNETFGIVVWGGEFYFYGVTLPRLKQLQFTPAGVQGSNQVEFLLKKHKKKIVLLSKIIS